jgi:RHS repeat-associated protein
MDVARARGHHDSSCWLGILRGGTAAKSLGGAQENQGRSYFRRLCLILSVLGVGVLFSSHVNAQGQCYGYYYPWNGTLFSTPQAACSLGGTENGSLQNSAGGVTQWTLVLGGLYSGSPATNNAIYICNNIQTITGTPWNCYINPGYCGTHVYRQGLTHEALVSSAPAGCGVFVKANVQQGEVCTANCVPDPINPAVGNVYTVETDLVFSKPSPIHFQRFYNSADSSGVDNVPGWRHTYDRSITVLSQGPVSVYSGQSSTVSAQYSTQADACVQGFAEIQGAVPGWASASASFSGSTCIVTNSSGNQIATLPVYSEFAPAQSPTPIEYDLYRDDGQVLRYTIQGTTITPPAGISIRLETTASGFTVTDDDDNVETYNAEGVLQSITSRSGVEQTIAYDTNSLFQSVTDSFGNTLSVTRNTQGSIATVVAGGNAVQYSYNGGLSLSSVTNADGTTRSYPYTNTSFPFALTGIVDEAGTQYTTWGYNSAEQATSTEGALGTDSTTLTYNSDGSVTVTDALGAVRTFSYSRVGDINKVAAISGSQCPTCQEMAATTYDAYGLLASRSDYNGNLTCYQNDPARGLELVRVEGFAPGSTCPTSLASYTPASGTTQRKISTTWSATYRLPTLITEMTRTTAFGYDSSGNLLTKTITDTTVSPNVSRTWAYTYDGFGRVLTAQSPRTDVNSTRTYTYYGCTSGAQCGQVQTVTDEIGHVTTFNTYNAYGQPLTTTDPNGVVTTLTYDTRQRITSRSTAGETTSVTYYPTGLVKKVTLPDSSFLQYAYDAAHRLTGFTDSLGDQVTYTLDALGNHTAENVYDPSNALALTRTQVFNTLSELSQQIGSAGTSAVTTSFGYDAQGNRTSISAPLSRNTANQYDALNRLAQITDPGNGVTHFSYDTNDNLTAVVDPRSLTTGYTYNGFGDQIQQSSPDTGSTVNTYDSGGNLATSTDARSQTGTYTYDARNRVTQIAYGDQTITLGYDTGTNGVGRLTSAGDANHALGWSYDALGRVVGKTQTVGSGASAITKSVSYTYTNGDLTSLVTPSGQTITYGYTNSQVTSIAVNGNALLSQVLYQPFGPVSGWTWANNTNEARVYDQDGNLTNLESAEGFTYTHDSAFRITGITDTDNSALSQSYVYDALDRLNSATGTSLNESWTYDANGNRLTQGGATSSTYTVAAASNQIASISGGLARTYAYAPSGQATSYGGLTFTYMDSGRLSAVSTGSATTAYVLNALGQRIKKSGTSVTLFVYDESGHLLGEYDGSGNLVEETVWMGDVPVATLQPNGTGVSVYYIHTDHLNTPRRITSPGTNAVVWRWDSEPFGTAAANQNPSGSGTPFVYNPRFPGQYYDSETGLSYNYLRDYDPATGRYVESDPIGLIGGSYSTYVYAMGDTLIYIDPLGLCWVYSQSTGRLTHVDATGNVTNVATGYAGIGTGVNNPALQNVASTGPLPQGSYTVGPQQTNVTSDGHRLPASMRLIPDTSNQMFNRAGFLIHGPHANDQHNSSNGCPIFPRQVRDQIGNSNDTCFRVVQ